MWIIIEVVATVMAWRKGWRWRALLPGGLSVVLGFTIGIVVTASGGNIDDYIGLCAIFDLLALGVLVFMNCRTPKHVHEDRTSREHPELAVSNG